MKFEGNGHASIRFSMLFGVTAIKHDGTVILQIADSEGRNRPSTLAIPVGGSVDFPVGVDVKMMVHIDEQELIDQGWRPPLEDL